MGIVELFTLHLTIYAVFFNRMYLEIKIWNEKWGPPVGPIASNVLISNVISVKDEEEENKTVDWTEFD